MARVGHVLNRDEFHLKKASMVQIDNPRGRRVYESPLFDYLFLSIVSMNRLMNERMVDALPPPPTGIKNVYKYIKWFIGV